MILTLAILCFLAMAVAVAAFVVCVDAADQQGAMNHGSEEMEQEAAPKVYGHDEETESIRRLGQG
jgi:hypothetical protein